MRPPILRLHTDELIVDNFAGGGGASLGIEMALGRSPDVAVNHDPEAIAMHAANHPGTEHYCESVWDIDPIKVCAGRPVGLAWFSPDCFPAGALVMTDKGYRPIDCIRVGDMVLTHKLRWRAVTECSSTVRPLIQIRGHGHPGLLVSPEHPFYAREQFRVWNNDRRTYDHFLHPATWTPASAVEKGTYWGTPRVFPAAVAPAVAGRGIVMTDELMWLAGRYLGDGWTRLTDTRAELVITCGMHEVGRLRDLLNRWPRVGGRSISNELAWHERATRTAYQFTTSHRGLVEWLREHFGHRAEAKGVPAWALGLPSESREALLEGYLSADGHKFEHFVEAHTVSKSLAFGLKALANSLGKTVAVYCRPNSSVIEGRDVNARALFKVRGRHDVDAEHAQTYIEDCIEWCPVREQLDVGESAEVFNIGVEEDESYVVEGIIVHNCKHFSKAKGGKPVEKKIRGLAWVVVKWAKLVRPRVIMLENVEEFQTWGPLGEDNRPCPVRKGHTFRRWCAQLEKLGYRIEMRELRACDYGAPTIRKRLFIVARCDGLPIVWPLPTHGASRTPYRTAAECIEWSIPCPSIFERQRPLAEATLRRIAKGVQRYVIDAAQPFIVPLTHQGDSRTYGMDEPFRTVTSANRGELAMISPTLIQTGYGEREGQAPRVPGLGKPLGTVVAGGTKHALVSAFLAQHNAGYCTTAGRRADAPISTITSTGAQQQLVASSLVKLYGTCEDGQPVDKPMPTVTADGNHIGEVRAFLLKYYGTDQDPQLFEPMHTVTTKHRFGLVMVKGQPYVIADIGMRMLAPRELYRAQGFPDSYRIDLHVNGRPLTKTAQVRMCGNSVSPPIAAAIVAAQFAHHNEEVAA